ncbi:MAG: Serine/threonine-protein kinase PknD [Firmicutes bacterium ADurb.Bin193]|nr:MAG: Serine/threonine-protein kinase PknD [Firmicutes bacterium ADurb.Bin193]
MRRALKSFVASTLVLSILFINAAAFAEHEISNHYSDYAAYIKKGISLSGTGAINGDALSAEGNISLTVFDDSNIIDGTLYHKHDAMIALCESSQIKMGTVSFDSIAYSAPVPSFPSTPVINNYGGTLVCPWYPAVTISQSTRYDSLTISGGITIDTGSSDIIITTDYLTLSGGYINLDGSGDLYIFVNESISITGSFKFNEYGNSDRVHILVKKGDVNISNYIVLNGNIYMEQGNISFLFGGSKINGNIVATGDAVSIANEAQITGIVYAPNAHIYITSSALVTGVMVGNSLDITGHADIDYSKKTLCIPDFGIEPTPTPSPTLTPSEEPTPTPEPSEEPTPTPTPSEEPTPTPEPSEEPTTTPEPSEEPTPTPEPSEEPTPTPTPSEEPTPTPEPTCSPDPGDPSDPIFSSLQYTAETFAGTGIAGFNGDNGSMSPRTHASATDAELYHPRGLAIDANGSLYIADERNGAVRKVSNGSMTTVTGNGIENGYTSSDYTGPAYGQGMYEPMAVAVSSCNLLYFLDTDHHIVRMIDENGNLKTVAGVLEIGSAGGYSDGGGVALNAKFNTPQGIAVDSFGNIYVADTNNHIIRKITKNGEIINIAGQPGVGAFSGDGGKATDARLNRPMGLATDSEGNLYIADTHNHRIRKINLSTGIITTVAGSDRLPTNSATADGIGDYGTATSAALFFPHDVAVDAAGNIYIADSQNHRIRKVIKSSGKIVSIAGDGYGGTAANSGAATSIRLNHPKGVEVDENGCVYISDTQNNVIRKLIPNI